jgi:hypothetical protein
LHNWWMTWISFKDKGPIIISWREIFQEKFWNFWFFGLKGSFDVFTIFVSWKFSFCQYNWRVTKNSYLYLILHFLSFHGLIVVCNCNFERTKKSMKENRVRTKLKFVFGVCEYLSWHAKIDSIRSQLSFKLQKNCLKFLSCNNLT